MLGETLTSFDHFLYLTLWCSRVLNGNENVGRAIENLFCLRFSFDARGSNSGPVSTEAPFPMTWVFANTEKNLSFGQRISRKTKHNQTCLYLFSPVSTDPVMQKISGYFTLK